MGRNAFRQKFVNNNIADKENIYPEIPHIDFSKYSRTLSNNECNIILSNLTQDSSSDSDDYENVEELNQISYLEEEEYFDSDVDILQDLNNMNQKSIQQESSNNIKTTKVNKGKQNTLLNYYLKTQNDVNENTNDSEKSSNSGRNNEKHKDTCSSELHFWNQLPIIKNEGLSQYHITYFFKKTIRI